MVNTIENYLKDGCGRCKYFATDKCKVRNWQNELVALRKIIEKSGLVETIKWGVPVYTLNNKNVVILSALKKSVTLGFLKGVLLKDPEKLFQLRGKSMQSARVIHFDSLQMINELQKKNIIADYIQEAITVEKCGEKIEFKKNIEPIPHELLQKFNECEAFKEAFFALTPGRQRGYIIFFSKPKQSITRSNAIEKYRQRILDGIGLNDR